MERKFVATLGAGFMLLAGCQGQSTGSADAQPLALPAPPPGTSTADPIADFDPYRPFPRWDYRNKQDAMTDQATAWARVSSEETVEFGFPYEGKQSATLVVRHGPGRSSDVFMYLQKGQIECNGYSDYGCPLRVRFDSGAPELVNGAPPDDHDSAYVFLPSPDRMIQRIAEAKTLRIEVTVFQQGTHVFTFDVDKLDLQKLGVQAPVSRSSDKR